MCAAQTHKMIVAVTESTVDNGSTSGSDSAEIGRLEDDEAGGLESVEVVGLESIGLGMLAARANNPW